MSLSATQSRERNNQSLDILEDERHHEVRELIQKKLAALGGGAQGRRNGLGYSRPAVAGLMTKSEWGPYSFEGHTTGVFALLAGWR